MRQESDNIRDLRDEPISKLMWRYFIPAVASMILNSVYTIVDRIFIGQGVGASALAAIGSVFPIIMIIAAFITMLGMGGGVNVSINLGRKKYEKAERVLGNTLLLAILSAAILTEVGYWVSSPILTYMGVESITHHNGLDYLTIIVSGITFNIVGNALNNLIHSEGNPRLAVIFMLCSLVLNVFLDYIFIFQLMMGLKGAAYATILSQAFLAILGVLHFRSRRSVIKLRLVYMKFNKNIVRSIIVVGFAPFCMHLSSSVGYSIVNMQLLKFGDELAVAAFGVIMGVVMFVMMSMVAVTTAMQPIVSFNYGAKNYGRVRSTLILGIGAATVISLIGFAIINIFPQQLISLFNSDNTRMVAIGIEGIQIYLCVLPLAGFPIVMESYFQSIGKGARATCLTLTRQVMIFIPLLLILPNYFGLRGVWMSAPVADLIYAIIVVFYVIYEFRKITGKLQLNSVKSV
ncbi:MATE family efflux transporter [Puteibacter caeruleilacunae]|nr:MATE family efflux transporter [Puteibacter caeruleilacunae]